VIAPNTPVWRRGWKEWRPAYDVPELMTSALAAANGLVQNIPPPPLAVVAVQHQYEGEAVPKVRPEIKTEPPPPPSYVPAPTRPAHGQSHVPVERISAAPASQRATGVQVPPAHPIQNVMTTLDGPPPTPNTRSDNAVTASSRNLEAIPESNADAILAGRTSTTGSLSTVIGVPQLGHDSRSAAWASDRMSPPIPAVPLKPIALSSLVRATSRPPPAQQPPSVPPGVQRVHVTNKSSRPPPPLPMRPKNATLMLDYDKANGPKPPPESSPHAPPVFVPGGLRSAPHTSTKPPPFGDGAAHAPPVPRGAAPPKDVIEELSGSILLPDQSSSLPRQTDDIEELSGSILLADPSGQFPPVSSVKPSSLPSPTSSSKSGKAPDELSSSFLLDVGSTGALPSVDDTGANRLATPPPVANGGLSAGAVAGAPASSKAIEAQPAPAPFPIPATQPAAFTPAPPPAAFVSADATAPMGMPALSPNVLPPSPSAPPPPFAPPAGLAPHEPTPLGPPASLQSAPPPPAHGSISKATLMGVAPASFASHAAIAPPVVAAAAPTEPTPASPLPPKMAYDARTDASEPGAPPAERSSARLHDMSSLRPGGRARFMLPALAALGVIVLLGVIGLIVGAIRKRPSELESSERENRAEEAATSANAAPAPAIPGVSNEVPAPAAACALAGAAHVVAPRAIVQSGVEVQQVGSRIALGFATAAREGIAVAVDPATLAATQTVRVKAGDTIRRVVPIAAGKGLGASADVDRHHDHLLGRRTISGEPAFDLGLDGAELAWAPHQKDRTTALWPLEGAGAVEALRATPLEIDRKEGYAIAFRRGASIYAGAVTGDRALTAKGPLVKVAGLGGQVGSPSVAASGGAILVAWADRASGNEPWSIRWMRFAPGDGSADTKVYVPAERGLGGHAMAPAIVAAGKGRFLLVWTEGPVSNHQVRAQTLTAAGAPIGAPMTISAEGVNAGQAQVVVTPEGRGVVAYLAASGAGGKLYEVLATPVVCP
jgi:hypothetical protein